MAPRIVVLGGGSAGFLAALALQMRLPHWDIVMLHSSELGIIGVGEGSFPTLTHFLHGYIRLDIAEFYKQVNPTWKLGIHFLWGSRPSFNYSFHSQFDSQYQQLEKSTGYYCGTAAMPELDIATALMNRNKVFQRQANSGIPAIGHDIAYHLENEHFVAYLAQVATKRGIRQVDVTISEVLQNEHGVSGLRTTSGEIISGDLYVDCSGFRSVLLGNALHEPFIDFSSTLFCDTAVVGGWSRTNEPIKSFTTAETMQAGWCWQIEHEKRINRGYVYSSAYLTAENAEQEFRQKNPKIEQTRLVKFKTGCYQRNWVKNVVAIGNASGFVEPLEATALGVICYQAQALAEILVDCESLPVTSSMQREFNKHHAQNWEHIRQFLAVHYKFNTRLETPFWQDCRAKVNLAGAEEIVAYYQENGPSLLWRDTLLHAQDYFKLDGYWTLLLGQNVPYAKQHTPHVNELETLQKIHSQYARQAERAFTIPEALTLTRSPQWEWNAAHYEHLYPAVMAAK